MQCKASERHEILVPTLGMLVEPADYNGGHLNEGDVVRHAGTTDTERCVRSECSQTFEYSDALALLEWLVNRLPNLTPDRRPILTPFAGVFWR